MVNAGASALSGDASRTASASASAAALMTDLGRRKRTRGGMRRDEEATAALVYEVLVYEACNPLLY
jgi:hypothetical protein